MMNSKLRYEPPILVDMRGPVLYGEFVTCVSGPNRALGPSCTEYIRCYTGTGAERCDNGNSACGCDSCCQNGSSYRTSAGCHGMTGVSACTAARLHLTATGGMDRRALRIQWLFCRRQHLRDGRQCLQQHTKLRTGVMMHELRLSDKQYWGSNPQKTHRSGPMSLLALLGLDLMQAFRIERFISSGSRLQRAVKKSAYMFPVWVPGEEWKVRMLRSLEHWRHPAVPDVISGFVR